MFSRYLTQTTPPQQPNMLFKVDPAWLSSTPSKEWISHPNPPLYMNQTAYYLWLWLGDEKYREYVDNIPRCIRAISDETTDPNTTHIKTFIRNHPNYRNIPNIGKIKIMECHKDSSLAIIYCANIIDDYFLTTITPYLTNYTKLRLYAQKYESRSQVNFEFSASIPCWTEFTRNITSLSLMGYVSAHEFTAEHVCVLSSIHHLQIGASNGTLFADAPTSTIFPIIPHLVLGGVGIVHCNERFHINKFT